jgi:hypothetical protein
MASTLSARSRNSSLRPGSRIRWDSDPLPALRVASAMRFSGASILPARTHPPTSPNTRRNASMRDALGAKARQRSDLPGMKGAGGDLVASSGRRRSGIVIDCSGTYRRRKTHTTAISRPPASMRKPA